MEQARPDAASGARQGSQSDPAGYADLVSELKQRIATARMRASLSVNRELVLLYWSIGRDILARQRNEGWGARVIAHLGDDLRRAFPEMTGLSARNLSYMRAFAEAWPDHEFVQQVVALLPWGHNVRLLDAVKAPVEREWYARQAIENGWSRNVLVHQIDSGLFRRQGGALTNFSRTLPAEQSELAQQLLRVRSGFFKPLVQSMGRTRAPIPTSPWPRRQSPPATSFLQNPASFDRQNPRGTH